jgi:predicted TIM-barrel fold metal-dependent hydrolase
MAEGHGEIEVIGAVHIEGIAADPLKETRYIQAQADTAPIPIGVVAYVDLSAADAEKRLETQAVSARALRGIRQILNRHPNKLYSYVEREFMAEAAWQRGFGLLKKFSLSFDLQLYPHQMAAAASLAAANPDVPIVLNHAGMLADRNLQGWRTWRAGIRTLAARENVFVKISGLGMFDHHWTIESFRPYVLEVIDAFGTGRAMFASNFPVDKLFSGFAKLWRAFDDITRDFSDADRAALFRDTARSVYRLADRVH